MTVETGRAALDTTFQAAMIHRCEGVKLKYAGGESLLRFPFVVELQRYAQDLSERYGLILDGVVLSNGTCLTDEIIDTMRTLKLRLMISLDGLGEVQDRQRPYLDGRASSADVIRAVQLAVDRGLIPHISITAGMRNAEKLSELVGWVLEQELPFSINFYRPSVRSAAFDNPIPNHPLFLTGMRAMLKVVKANLPRYSLLTSLIDHANLSTLHRHPCSAGRSYLVFDPLGRISQCHMQMDRPVTTIASADPLAEIRAAGSGFKNLSVDQKETCATCEWRYWCAGGCPLTTYHIKGRYDTNSPYCSIYKSLYPEIIQLEGWRLLKWWRERAKNAN